MSEPLTDQQIANWRTVLCGIVGPYALIMPVEQVQAYRDSLQRSIKLVTCEESVE